MTMTDLQTTNEPASTVSRRSAQVIEIDEFRTWEKKSVRKEPDLLDIDEFFASQYDDAGYVVEARARLAEHVADEHGSRSLKALRLSRGLSQADLAEAAGTNQPHIARIESGATGINFATAMRISRALSISSDELAEIIGIE